VNRSVVNITTEAKAGSSARGLHGGGSGFVLDKAGHILTNFHVIQEADSVRVKLFDGSAHDARSSRDLANDVAVLSIQVPAEKLVPVKFGDSSRVLSARRSWRWAIRSGWSGRSRGIISSLTVVQGKNGRMIKGSSDGRGDQPGNSGGRC